MTKSRIAKVLAAVGQGVSYAATFLAPKYAHYALAIGAFFTGWSIKLASDTSAGHPNGAV